MRSLAKYFAIARISARSSSTYLADLAGRTGFFILILFILSRVWDKLLGAGTVEGLKQRDLVWYLVFTESLLLAVPPFEQNIEEEVRSGSVAYLMIRPVHYLGHHLAAFLGEVSVRLSLNLLVGAPFALLLGGPPPAPPAGIPWALVATLLGLTLHFHLLACLALIAFWLEETRPFFWIYQKLLFTAGGLMIPMEFFPGWLRTVLDHLPFSSVLYAPARLGVRYDPALAFGLIARQALWLGVFVALSHAIYRRAATQLQVNGG
ncbi:MAG: ABC-2 family transporter protein [Candidatus Wallbacteria bacterium]|nr:ABC-2 family transporter protein [Candidatus Wallbacteria bacterium]